MVESSFGELNADRTHRPGPRNAEAGATPSPVLLRCAQPMESPPEPKSVHAMTADERRRLMSRRTVDHAAEAAMEIGGTRTARRLLGMAGRLAIMLALAAVFVAAFYHFTASWRVAMIGVGLMGAYMLAVGRIVEGRADRIE